MWAGRDECRPLNSCLIWKVVSAVLTKLNLSDNALGDEGVLAISEAIAQASSLALKELIVHCSSWS